MRTFLNFTATLVWLASIANLNAASGSTTSTNSTGNRDSRLLVHVKQDATACAGTGNKADVFGVCSTAKNCKDSNGVKIGVCTSSQICCQKSISSASNNATITVIKEAAITITQSGVGLRTFEIPKRKGICQIKLNFLGTALAKPSAEILSAGACIQEYITVSGSSTLPRGKITVCGNIAQQHMYLSMKDSKSVKIAIKTSDKSTRCALNVVQLSCDSTHLVPDDCLQLYDKPNVEIRSFGFPNQLNDQYYRICTQRSSAKQSDASEILRWKECEGSSNPRPFFITGWNEDVGPEEGEIRCSDDYLLFSSNIKVCGSKLLPTEVPRNRATLDVYFDSSGIGSSVVINNLPPSLTCDKIDYPAHTCEATQSYGRPACVCTVGSQFPLEFQVQTPANEPCLTASGYYCTRMDSETCWCTELYHEADRGNTGFCLTYEVNNSFG